MKLYLVSIKTIAVFVFLAIATAVALLNLNVEPTTKIITEYIPYDTLVP